MKKWISYILIFVMVLSLTNSVNVRVLAEDIDEISVTEETVAETEPSEDAAASEEATDEAEEAAPEDEEESEEVVTEADEESVSEERLIPDWDKTLREGAILFFKGPSEGVRILLRI